jgi:hypothetical protein
MAVVRVKVEWGAENVRTHCLRALAHLENGAQIVEEDLSDPVAFQQNLAAQLAVVERYREHLLQDLGLDESSTDGEDTEDVGDRVADSADEEDTPPEFRQ